MSKSSKNSSKSISETDKAYIAGLIDGDGCIGLYKRDNKHYRRGFVFLPQVRIYQIHKGKEVIQQVAKIYNGRISKNNRNPPLQILWQVTLEWRKCIPILKDIIPYLRIKKEQGKLLLDFFRWCPKSSIYTSDLQNRRQIEIYNKLAILNLRGSRKPNVIQVVKLPSKKKAGTRELEKPELTKSDLTQLYLIKGISQIQIANLKHCSWWRVKKYLLKHKIPLRTRSEASKKRWERRL